MNVLKGKIIAINENGGLSLISIKIGEVRFSAIVIDTVETAPYMKLDRSIKVIFKETEVIIGKCVKHEISLQNRLLGTIVSVESDKLLSKIVIDTSVGEISSIITTNAVKQLELSAGVQVTAMIKTNEIMLSE